MPPIPPPHLSKARRRMKMGLHPAVVEAVARATGLHGVADRPGDNVGVQSRRRIQEGLRSERLGPQAPNRGAGTQVSLGAGTGKRGAFKRYLQRDPEGGLRELHVYDGPQGRQVMAFNRLTEPAPEVMAKLNQSPRQQLARTATADDKLAAIALKLGQRRKFSRNPGPLRRY